MNRKQFDSIIEAICYGYYWADQGYKPIHDKFAVEGKEKTETLWRYIQKLQKKAGK